MTPAFFSVSTLSRSKSLVSAVVTAPAAFEAFVNSARSSAGSDFQKRSPTKKPTSSNAWSVVDQCLATSWKRPGTDRSKPLSWPSIAPRDSAL